ncbi:hypothetical protein GCM10025874_05550 [Arenivirga flava]|uniref:Alpha/beta hydrolase n=1 Tax=Arenivirga flava TaxID=1930060 RepID=A0AA37XAZ7_9MICO|nr:hypothetical protein GCM10025874_05550 [Arenivirga flava]
MAAEPQRRVEQDGARALQRRGEQLDAPLEQDGDVTVVVLHGFLPAGPLFIDPHPATWHRGRCARAVGWGSTIRDQKRPGITSSDTSENSASCSA